MIRKSITCLFLLLTVVASAGVPIDVNQGDSLSSFQWSVKDLSASELKAIEGLFKVDTIVDCTMNRMLGKSYPKDGCCVSRCDLRYLILPHYDGKGTIRIGEMVCNRAIANELVDLFKTLFLQEYPIERMVLIDNYEADDVKSMEANNTSCFNYRRVAGSCKLSRHSYAMAIDINPLYNPYVKGNYVSPKTGKPYVSRSKTFPYKLTRNDIVYRILHDKYGFTWGGEWRSCKDYQHFEK